MHISSRLHITEYLLSTRLCSILVWLLSDLSGPDLVTIWEHLIPSSVEGLPAGLGLVAQSSHEARLSQTYTRKSQHKVTEYRALSNLLSHN